MTDIEDIANNTDNKNILYSQEDEYYKKHEIFNKRFASSYRYSDVQSQTDLHFQDYNR